MTNGDKPIVNAAKGIVLAVIALITGRGGGSHAHSSMCLPNKPHEYNACTGEPANLAPHESLAQEAREEAAEQKLLHSAPTPSETKELKREESAADAEVRAQEAEAETKLGERRSSIRAKELAEERAQLRKHMCESGEAIKAQCGE